MADYRSEMREIPGGDSTRRETDIDGALIEMSGPDSDVVIYLDGEEKETASDGFHDNLAESMDKGARIKLAEALCDAVDIDEESRASWKQRLTKGLELMGLKDMDEEDEAFPGASSVTYPLISEAIVQFQSRTLPEMIPSSGPIKTTVIGERTWEKTEQAKRVAGYLNYRLTVDDGEWFDDTDQMLFYLPFGGSAFRKVYEDPISGKAKSRYVKAEDFIVPYKAKSLADAQRYTHKFEMHANDIKRAIHAGDFIDVDVDDTGEPDENDEIEDTADDREPSVGDQDAVHTIYEVHCYQTIDSDSYSESFDLPYVITVDQTQNDILSIRRNWREDDDNYEKIIWFAHYRFLPGLGFYGFGFLHMIGGLAEAASGAMRALLDSAARANLQGGFKSKDARAINGETVIPQGEWIDTDLTGEELQRAFYTPNWGQPSPTLFQLLGTMIEAAQRFSNITDAMVGDANNNAPVGTTVALIEQGQKVFSAIHRRLHRAAGLEYRLFADLDARTMGEEPYPFVFDSESMEVRSDDFSDEVDIVPVSDPNIFSETQRIARAQALVQVTAENPDLYGNKQKREAHKRLLESLNVPDPDAILPEESAQRLDPITENQYMMTGKGVTAYPDQDHQAHIKIHKTMMEQYAEAQGQAVQRMMAAAEAHIAEHHAYAYRQQIQRLLPSMALNSGMHPEEDPEQMPVEVENELSKLVAEMLPEVATPAERAEQQEKANASAEQQRKAMESKAEIQRKQMAEQAEQKRKTAAMQAEQQRKAAQLQAEEQRKAASHRAEMQRDAQEWQQDERQEEVGWQQDQTREQAEWEAQQAREKADRDRETHNRSLDEMMKNADRSLNGGSKKE